MDSATILVAPRQLPPGYPRSIEVSPDPPHPPVTPRPAATVALLRPGNRGMEVLLLRRNRRARFIPGAYVFPGGRVDDSDADPALRPLIAGPSPEDLDSRLGLSGGHPPGIAFWAAALREAFEETGILLESGGRGFRSVPKDGVGEESRLRRELHRGSVSFPEVLVRLGAVLSGDDTVYIGHWVTPVQERYRYDTRFFGAEVPEGCPAFPDGSELVEAVWITPSEALTRNREGTLPMVFPTLLTLQALTGFESPSQALLEMGRKEIRRLLPRVEGSREGVRMVLNSL